MFVGFVEVRYLLTVAFDPDIEIFGWWGVDVYPDCFSAGTMVDGIDGFAGDSFSAGDFETCADDEEEIGRWSRSDIGV
jgi:hypothetical protein